VNVTCFQLVYSTLHGLLQLPAAIDRTYLLALYILLF